MSSALWNNGGSDPSAVWHHRSGGSRNEAGIGVWQSVHGKGYFWGEFGPHHCNQLGLYGVRVSRDSASTVGAAVWGGACGRRRFSAKICCQAAISHSWAV